MSKAHPCIVCTCLEPKYLACFLSAVYFHCYLHEPFMTGYADSAKDPGGWKGEELKHTVSDWQPQLCVFPWDYVDGGGSIPFTLVSDYTQVSSPSYAVSPSPNCRSLFWQIIGTARILGGLEGEKLTAEGLIASAVHVSLWDCVEGLVSISSTLVSDYTQISSLSYGVSPSSLICTSLFWQVMGTALGGERLTAEWLTASAVHDMLPYEIV